MKKMDLKKNLISKTCGKTKFEEDLKIYFPDLYQFWELSKLDPFYRELIEGILEMVNSGGYGTLKVIYQGGKINTINLDKQLTAGKSKKLDK